ncbi:hypothetical protein CDL15_Pgr006875 [Punica granatum]|uniref:Chloroplast thylakoid membrane n=1 Tax=Punica granatum TaxID=22663 RepID=A0A218X7A8_PUNGR|nr:hypothetical protein CDL15_Pgr006875 [Punica granatum]
MAPFLQRFISASASPSGPPPFPPKPPFPSNSLSVKPQSDDDQQQLRCNILRRDFAALALLALAPARSLARPYPAAAFSIGISGPKEWLKEQKKKSSKFLLAPIDASRESLRSAYAILIRDSDYTNKDLEEVLRLSKSAARDCVPQDRNSFVNFQANTGVEVCTFKLIVKNAASLLADKDPVKLEAEAILDNLIRSFSSLNGLANEMDLQPTSNSRQRAVDALKDTISSLDKFEQAIKDCLEV